MIVDYSLAFGEGSTRREALIDLQQKVEERMKYGWQPLGAPFHVDREYHFGGSLDVYCQALAKTAE